MKKLSVLLLIMMMAVAAVSAEESVEKEVESTEVEVAKKILPFYIQGGISFGYHGVWGYGFTDIPLTVGYQVKDNIAVQGTLNLYVPYTDSSVSNNVHTKKCTTFDIDVLFYLKNKKADAKFNRWLSAGLGFGNTSTTWESGGSEEYGEFQVNVGAGLEKPVNEHLSVGGDAKIGFGSLFTIGCGAYIKYML